VGFHFFFCSFVNPVVVYVEEEDLEEVLGLGEDAGEFGV
jgi:hypothetical protein